MGAVLEVWANDRPDAGDGRLVASIIFNSSIAADTEAFLVDVGILEPAIPDGDREGPSSGRGFVPASGLDAVVTRIQSIEGSVSSEAPWDDVEDAFREAGWLGADAVLVWT